MCRGFAGLGKMPLMMACAALCLAGCRSGARTLPTRALPTHAPTAALDTPLPTAAPDTPIPAAGLDAPMPAAPVESTPSVEPAVDMSELLFKGGAPVPIFPQAIEMIELLYYMPGGGGSRGTCDGARAGVELPAGEISRMNVLDTMQQARLLCLYGFRLGEKVTIELIDPAGRLADQRVYQAAEELQSVWDERSMSVIAIQLNPSLYFSPGEWLVRAWGSNGNVEVSLPLAVCPPVASQPASTDLYNYRDLYQVSIHSPQDPPESMFDPRGFASFTGDETLAVRGACYPPRSVVTVGVFHSKDGRQSIPTYKLVGAFRVVSSEYGSFEALLNWSQVFAEAGGGQYAILPMPRGIQIPARVEIPDLYTLPYAGFEIPPLPEDQGCFAAARFRVGDRAGVGAPLAVYSQVGTGIQGGAGEYFLAELPAGETVELVGGPRCTSTTVWWQVHGLSSGLAGWVDQAGLR